MVNVSKMNDTALSSKYKLPKPGVNGAISNVLRGKTIVLTGIFPQVGGGKGLYIGKHRVKIMCENFGGRVTNEISGQTDILVVGVEPGLVKVSQAFAYRVQQINFFGLHSVIMGLVLLKDVIAPDISHFSTGYNGNGLPLLLSREEKNNKNIQSSKELTQNINLVEAANKIVESKILKKKIDIKIPKVKDQKKIKRKIPKEKDLIIVKDFTLQNDGFCFINAQKLTNSNSFHEECLNRDGFCFI